MSEAKLLCQSCFRPIAEAGATCTRCNVVDVGPRTATTGAAGPSGGGAFGGALERLDADRVSRARNILLLVAVLATFGAIVSYLAVSEVNRSAATQVLAMNGSLAASYFGIWVWSRSTVLLPAIVALGIFVGIILLNAAVDPSSLTQGVLLRGIIIVALIGAIREARIAQSFSGRSQAP
ncbi:MAG: hypothetical protein IPI49_00285 [Myxococcales bacterium]|nr:hypothetical protein [Myxococcales bacterium]